PAKMVFSFILGVAFAVGHHFYYSRLEDRKVIQEWKLRFGMGLSFLARVFLIAAVSIAYDQHVWAKARKEFIMISGLDAMFSAINYPWAFFNRHFLWHAKIEVAVAAIAW
ncbi:hypothetical protein BKA64DRAFT_583581, partial [Cadophora sp. MPI-SDFR-AT-0126]